MLWRHMPWRKLLNDPISASKSPDQGSKDTDIDLELTVCWSWYIILLGSHNNLNWQSLLSPFQRLNTCISKCLINICYLVADTIRAL